MLPAFVLDMLCMCPLLKLSLQQVDVTLDINPAPNPPISSRLAISQSVIRWL